MACSVSLFPLQPDKGDHFITIVYLSKEMKRATHLFGRALRETGQAMDRLGLTFSNNEIYKETFSRHRAVMNLYDKVSFTPF